MQKNGAVPVLLYCSVINWRMQCLLCSTSIRWGNVWSSAGSTSSQGGMAGRLSMSWFSRAGSSAVWLSICYCRITNICRMQIWHVRRIQHAGDLPALLGPPRSSKRRDRSSLKAWFLCLRPAARPQIGRSTGRATSTSWVISAKRITSCSTYSGILLEIHFLICLNHLAVLRIMCWCFETEFWSISRNLAGHLYIYRGYILKKATYI